MDCFHTLLELKVLPYYNGIMERVSIIEGVHPVILVAPHGAAADDYNTDIITETCAQALNCYAVINRGWERAEEVDYFKDKANCNDVKHCLEDVVKDEFLDPIIRFKNRIRKKHSYAYMFTIHGVGNDIRSKANDADINMVVGYGAGTPASHTCKMWMKDFFIYLMRQVDIKAYGGKAGGQYAGWAKNNLNQLFCKWPKYADDSLHSMQLEFIRTIRDTKADAEFTGNILAVVLEDLLKHGKWTAPQGFKINEV